MAATGAGHLFRVRAPLLSRGAQDHELFTSDLMWGHVKVYAEGGENTLHSHLEEDHCFIVLEGSAEFTNGDGETARLDRFDGIFLPRGTHYRFRNCGESCLVMLRVGGGKNSRVPGNQDDRRGADGEPLLTNPTLEARGEAVPAVSGAEFAAGPSPEWTTTA